jgi:DNA polymerase-1
MLDLQNEAHRAANVSLQPRFTEAAAGRAVRQARAAGQRRTPSGQPSTAEDVLEELAAQYDLPRIIMNYRALTKLKSTYTDKLPNQVNPRTGSRAHVLSPGRGGDGRLSSTEPNLQNIPIRTPRAGASARRS